jgi:hypothetical protein
MPKRGQLKSNATARSKQQREYNSKPEQKKRRAERNSSRRDMEKKGRVRKGDGKDVDHKNHNTGSKGKNLRVMSKSANRAKNLGRGGRPKGS